jgi:FkbM family methyltransferase
MQRLRDVMTPTSRLRYLAWRAFGVPETLTVRLMAGQRIFLRREAAREPVDDAGVAREVFVEEPYRSPRPLDRLSVKRLVDVGANVGYSILYFLREYPQAIIDAFEPHPLHCAQIESHLGANCESRRVHIHPVAVGSKAGCAKLSDEGVGSHLVSSAGAGLTVEVVDFFAWAGASEIDLLKLDCEGAEYDLVMDERFRTLKAKTIVLEWHATESHPEAERDILTRLESLGFEIVPISRADNEVLRRHFGLHAVGVAWAYRPEENHCE